ncbi:helicase-exonuclease AddAB subunit AddA [Metabacillus halosaccharovorans]|uniref:ATP-dependent helicase/nuclease subunit A n=1 Tax=Metabacillus halosaccharovorans TaxID=930124 RepID=A0ABT3DJ75_9BACI|nr:helicase-exonuclease AddAB subunit AddA [Metabacillus halosaccharovorans]MCV9887110.1 helicase-exonuclease AddAB subunit AddA [Metabacillus halosaccharovorans]
MNELIPKPENSQWTDDQWKAIVASGQDILVAAAAGSGKTAVLVERIIRKILNRENPVDVDSLLVVTFTNASAAEMRSRIGEALEKALKENPSSLHLRRQLTLLNKASISTLHSFCLQVVRKYYYLINIDPSFRIADQTEGQLLIDEVLDEMFEEEYSREENEEFFDLVDRYTSDRSDMELQSLIRELYFFSRSHPTPSVWLDQLTEMYDMDENEMNSLPFITYLLQDIDMQLTGAKDQLLQAMELTKQPAGPAPRAENLEDDLEQIAEILAHKDSWDLLGEQLKKFKMTRAKIVKGDQYDKSLTDQVTALRNAAKKQIEQLRDELFTRPLAAYIQDFQHLKHVVKKLVSLVQQFADRYEGMKKEKGIVDFADLEHYCLQILQTEEGQPSEAALYYKQQFVEVLVDEYQDTNLVQESILKFVTKDEEATGNLFMVGDVKQSIYRFRLAEPFLFLSKYKRFTQVPENTGMRIDLSKNFRSRSEVLDGTNYLFKQIMGETVGEIVYDHDAELKLGADYPENRLMSTELLLIERGGEDTGFEKEEADAEGVFDEQELETVQLEARLMAKKIKTLIDEQFQIYDRGIGGTRNITYRDVVILLRSMPWAPQIMEEFKQAGIPVYANLSNGYFEATEVAIMLSVLKIIDNPFQDIPLASALRSPVVGLSENELALIRTYDRKGTFYDAVKAFIVTEEQDHQELFHKLNPFIELLQGWRDLARKGSVSDLIWQLYRDTKFFDFVGGMPGGKQRQANLRALYDRARQYEATSFRGLFRFLRFIERMQDRGDDLGAARALGEQEDVVRLMTIHSSKGLEFPVVFVAGLSKQFNMMDLNKKYLLDKELGFGTKLINPKLRVSYPTLPYIALKKKMRMELLAEEMRVLYVALTRAKEKLYLLGTLKDPDKTMTNWRNHLSHTEWLLPDFERAKAKGYLDWIGPALIRHKDCIVLSEGQICFNGDIAGHPSRWTIENVKGEELKETFKADQELNHELLTSIQEGETVSIESELKEAVQHQLSWFYPYKQATVSRSKQSVTELKRQREVQDEYSDQQLIKKTDAQSLLFNRPGFMQTKSITPAERGTAMHAVMQHIDLQAEITEKTITQKIEELVQREILTPELAKVIDVNQITSFFSSDLGQRMVHARHVYREVPFSYALDADQLYKDMKDEPILIQGVIDCLFEDEQGTVLLDYKTDTIKGRFNQDRIAVEEILKDRYRIQIDLYTKAVEDILHRPLQEKYLFFFDGGYLINM